MEAGAAISRRRETAGSVIEGMGASDWIEPQ
jgi:hypothetical protein